MLCSPNFLGDIMLCESIASCKSIKEKAFLIMEHYKSSRLDNSMEPIWIHRAYEIVQEYLDDKLDKNNVNHFYDIVKSHQLPDGTEVPSFPNKPNSPVRIMHEGWKIGTPTWIFMGRKQSGAVKEFKNGWVVSRRVVPQPFQKLFDPSIPLVIYFAYNVRDQMGMSADTANCIGPAMDLNDLHLAIERQDNNK